MGASKLKIHIAMTDDAKSYIYNKVKAGKSFNMLDKRIEDNMTIIFDSPIKSY